MKASKNDRDELTELQIALVQTQIAASRSGKRILLVLEGRDTAGKDGAIKRIVEHLSIRSTRVVALPKPSDRERTRWYFQRYVSHLPAAGEFVIFNRSWYNRAGVEVVMGFSTEEEQAAFLRDVPDFERMLVESGITMVKLWLEISKHEQKKRLDARSGDPLKALKTSPLDAVAQKKWKDYSRARDGMLIRTHTPLTPWTIVNTDNKKEARLQILRHLVHAVSPPEIAQTIKRPDPTKLFAFDAAALKDGRLSK